MMPPLPASFEDLKQGCYTRHYHHFVTVMVKEVTREIQSD
jgi:hypothetical protein